MDDVAVGWIGTGRMGEPMAARLLDAGRRIAVYDRTRAKAEPLAAKGARVAASASELAACDVLFTMVSTGRDVASVLFGEAGVLSGGGAPAVVVDCSSISTAESAGVRERLAAHGVAFLAAPVSGNGACVRAGKLSAVVSGPHAAFERAKPLLETVAPRGAAYVGEGELSRMCKIAHNVLLGVVTQNLAEITVLAEKAGVPRAAFLSFINGSVMGSIFTRYKSHALVNLDWTTTFTPELLRKDLDLGLAAGRDLGVAMPVTAATREALQAHFGAARLKDDPDGYLAKDFACLLETVALLSGLSLTSEETPVPSGLEEGEDAAP